MSILTTPLTAPMVWAGGGSGSLRAFDADVLSWKSAVEGNGGSVSLDRLVIADKFVFDEKASGAWAITDDYHVLWGENAPQALTSLKRRALAVAYNSPTFTVDRGYAFDGATSYIDTTFVPSTHAVAMTATSVHMDVYERAEFNSNTYAGGVANASNRALNLRPRLAGNCYVAANSLAGTFTLPTASSLGLMQGGRNGSLVTDVYGAKNGVDMVRTVDPSGVGATLPVNSLFIGAYSNVGVATGFRASSEGFMAYGAALSGSQRLSRYNNVQAWATSVGAQV